MYPNEKKDTKFYFGRRGKDDDLRQLKKLLSRSKGKKTAPRGANYSTRYNPNSSKQFATVKMNYSDKKRSHEKFLKHYMVQANKDVLEKPVLFGKDESAHSQSGAYAERMTDRHFKFMVSPESPNVPLKEFTRAYMDAMSFELGVKFDWQAAVHTDTAHPHVHILINGADINGKALNRPFPKNFIQKRSHEIASEIITKMIGGRSQDQKNEANMRSFTSTRWTRHDEKISSIIHDKLVVIAVSEDMHKRLAHLCTLNLARFEKGVFHLQDKWQETLRNVGRYNSFLKARDELLWTPGEELELFKSGTISGVIRKTYSLNDEWENNNAIVLEDPISKKAYFVPLYNPPPSNADGKQCTITMTENAKGRLTPNINYEKNTPDGKTKKSEGRRN